MFHVKHLRYYQMSVPQDPETVTLNQQFECVGLTLSEPQVLQFQTYRDMVLRWNRRARLISENDEGRIMARHFGECTALAQFDEFKGIVSVLDLGTGGGFPGIPLKIVNPELSLTLLDSKRMKAVFLERLVRELELERVLICCERAEDAGQRPELARKFNLVVSRAVAELSLLYELSRPFLAQGGKLVAIKGSRLGAELEALRRKNAALSVAVKSLPWNHSRGGSNQNVVFVEEA